MKLKIIFSFIFILTTAYNCSAQNNRIHTRTKSYKSLRLTYEDLSELLLSMQEILNKAATDTSIIDLDQVSIGNKSEELILENNFEPEAFNGAPDRATEIRYRFSASKHAIEELTINFGNHRREVEIIGSSLPDIRILLAVINDHMATKYTIWGGFEFHIVILVFFLVTAFGLVFLAFHFEFSRKITNVKFILFPLAGIAFICAFFLQPVWYDLFPGTLIYQEAISWLSRSSPYIALIGLIITIVGVSFTVLHFYKKEVKVPQAKDTSGDTI